MTLSYILLIRLLMFFIYLCILHCFFFKKLFCPQSIFMERLLSFVLVRIVLLWSSILVADSCWYETIWSLNLWADLLYCTWIDPSGVDCMWIDPSRVDRHWDFLLVDCLDETFHLMLLDMFWLCLYFFSKLWLFHT